MPYAGVFVLVVLLVFNLIISQGVIRDGGLTAFQKSAQVVLLWLLPFLGGLVVLSMQGMNHTRSEMRELLPFPFYLAGHADPGASPFRQYPHDGDDISASDVGEGTCGSD
ncbi:MAG: hypothetical protein AAFX10_00125 [Pseudomonadota bacterium]